MIKFTLQKKRKTSREAIPENRYISKYFLRIINENYPGTGKKQITAQSFSTVNSKDFLPDE